MSPNQEAFKSLPAVDKLLSNTEVKLLLSLHGKELVLFSIRNTLDFFRISITKGSLPPTKPQILEKIKSFIQLFGGPNLKRIYNATGIIIHTISAGHLTVRVF